MLQALDFSAFITKRLRLCSWHMLEQRYWLQWRISHTNKLSYPHSGTSIVSSPIASCFASALCYFFFNNPFVTSHETLFLLPPSTSRIFPLPHSIYPSIRLPYPQVSPILCSHAFSPPLSPLVPISSNRFNYFLYSLPYKHICRHIRIENASTSIINFMFITVTRSRISLW